MARLSVIVLNLKPQILNSGPGDRDLRRYAKSIVDALSEVPLSPSDDPVLWLRGSGRRVKISPLPALLAFASYLIRGGVEVSIDKALFELSPDEREKAKKFLMQLNPPGPERMQEELLRLNDYLYLKDLEARDRSAIVVLANRPAGHAKRLEEFRVIEIDFLDDPVITYRRGIESVPFQVCVRFHEFSCYTSEEVLIKFWRQLQNVFSVMKRHLLHLFDSGAKPKSRSRPRLEHIPVILDKSLPEPLKPGLSPRQPSLRIEAQSINNELKALRELLAASTNLFVVPVTQVVNQKPYLMVGKAPNQQCIYLVNPSVVPAINLQIEYLSEEGRIIELFEVETLRSNETKELDSDFVADLRSQGAASLRLKKTGQTLRLP